MAWRRIMKSIVVQVPEPVYEDFQRHALKSERLESDLIREAMEWYRKAYMGHRTSLRDRQPASVGGPIRPMEGDDDLLGDMIHDSRD